MNKKVVLAISGGVDSSVSAYLLKKNGYQVEAIFMKNWDEDDGSEFCTAKQDYQDAQKVCKQLDIKLSMVNFSTEYYEEVFEDFLKEIKAGNTPNPDVFCNQKIKFGYLWDYAMSLGANYLATGHYAKIKTIDGKKKLFCAADKSKDQSYFLYAIKPECLSKLIFPLAKIQKSQVRNIANELNLVTAKKKDSTGICFIGERNFSEFLNRYLKSNSGEIIDIETNQVIGTHNGLINYTVGQRKGLGIGGNKMNLPWYVVRKCLDTNQLFIAQGNNHPALFHQRIVANNLNWLSKVKVNQIYQAKIRYRQKSQDCQIVRLEEDEVELVFKEPQRAITKAQAVVIYNGNECLGGATIREYYKN